MIGTPGVALQVTLKGFSYPLNSSVNTFSPFIRRGEPPALARGHAHLSIASGTSCKRGSVSIATH